MGSVDRKYGSSLEELQQELIEPSVTLSTKIDIIVNLTLPY